MSEKKWQVNYVDRKGVAGSKSMMWPDKPTMEDAAVTIRDFLLGEDYSLVSRPRGQVELTVFLLKEYGYEITSIVALTEQP